VFSSSLPQSLTFAGVTSRNRSRRNRRSHSPYRSRRNHRNRDGTRKSGSAIHQCGSDGRRDRSTNHKPALHSTSARERSSSVLERSNSVPVHNTTVHNKNLPHNTRHP
jgi:hypothetical protein